MIDYLNRLETIDSSLMDARKNLVLDMLEGKKILDIGCGTGFIANSIAKKGYDVTAIDIEPEGIKLAKKGTGKKRKVTFLVGDFFEFDFKKESFDCVLLTDVLEHIKEDDKLLRGIQKVLKKKGVLIILVPAIQFFFGYHDREIGHQRRYSKKNLKKQLNSAGFSIEKMRYWNMITIPMLLLFSKILNRPYPHSGKSTNKILSAYFDRIERRINMPIGVSLVVKVRKRG